MTIDLETGTPLQLETGVNFTLELPWQEALENPIEDIYVKTEGGNWVSIYASLIQDNMVVDNKTWSSNKITGTIAEQTALRTRWMGNWAAGTYVANDQVLDDGWLMIANKLTTDRPAPQGVGAPEYGYKGASPDAAITAKQIVFGNRYTAPPDIAFQITRYRVYTVIGNTYRLFAVRDPETDPIVNELLTFTANVDGWAELVPPTTLVPPGSKFDLVAIVNEPDPTPTTFSGTWNYTTPNNPATPASGQVSHSNKALSEFRIHKTDNDGGDRSAELGALTVGDIIDWGGGGLRWAIQSVTDNGTWINFGVSPATQESPDGNHVFTFETVIATPITRMEDVNWWGLNPPQNGGAVQGLYIENGDYPDIVPNTSAYGTDIQIQELSFSEDWDVQAVADGGVGAETALSQLEADWVRVSAEPYDIFNVQTTDNSWTTAFVIDAIPVGEAITGIGLVKAVRTDADDYYLTEFRAIAANTGGGIAVDETQLYELGPTQLAIRVQQVGLNAEVQVRGRNNQDWSWTGLVYFSPM